MNQSDLDAGTRKAQKDEEKRKEKLEKNRKLRESRENQLEANPQVSNNAVQVEGVMINPNHGPEESDVFILPEISAKLRPYQVEAATFIWENIISGSSEGSGCLLAHEMGLGKTLTTIAFLETFLREKKGKTVLVVVPATLIPNWKKELHKWIPDSHVPKIWELKKPFLENLISWESQGGILIVSYAKFARFGEKKGKVVEEEKELIFSKLVDPGPDIVVTDEGHKIKTSTSMISKSLKKIRTPRKICLTGYPLQNHLAEYWCMIDWLKPSLLGTISEFRNLFENPIKNGTCLDSTTTDQKLAKRRSFVLSKLLNGVVLRKDSMLLRQLLPPRQEYTISCHMSPLQRDLYDKFREQHLKYGTTGVLEAYTTLGLIGNHPAVLKKSLDEKRKKLKEANERGKLLEKKLQEEDEDKTIEELEYQIELGDLTTKQPLEYYTFVGDTLNIPDLERAAHSGKVQVLLTLLREAKKIGDRSLIFSKSIPTLNFLESKIKEEGMTSYRLDGSVPVEVRQQRIDKFNSPNSTVDVFFLSTRAGGLGINLTGANRVIMFDVSWNPCDDVEAAVRVFRTGQTKNTYIYRLLNSGAVDERVYRRQLTKEGLSKRVVDSAPTSRLFTTSDQELFETSFSDPSEPPKIRQVDDPLLVSCIKECPNLIRECYRHDLLLDPDLEERLPDEEQQAAEEDYRVAKSGGYHMQNQPQQPSQPLQQASQSDLHHFMTTQTHSQLPSQPIVLPESLIRQATYRPDPNFVNAVASFGYIPAPVSQQPRSIDLTMGDQPPVYSVPAKTSAIPSQQQQQQQSGSPDGLSRPKRTFVPSFVEDPAKRHRGSIPRPIPPALPEQASLNLKPAAPASNPSTMPNIPASLIDAFRGQMPSRYLNQWAEFHKRFNERASLQNMETYQIPHPNSPQSLSLPQNSQIQPPNRQ
eukprot:TRINITY_DN3349_c0_g1_i18.p1 TRINITY_DN3349_c0_g1~~TRINITY_DN3349_c0_g1_i18.p1  ORF type:complete len:923 (-),score=326.02 TRINITY_DN3349_c0_g1_i18:659-3427(-)